MKQSVFLNVNMQRLLSRSSTTPNTQSKAFVRRKNHSINAKTTACAEARDSECKKIKLMSYSADKSKESEDKQQEVLKKTNQWVFQNKRKPHVTDSGDCGLSRALLLKNTTISSHNIANVQTQFYQKVPKSRHNTLRTNKTETSALIDQTSQKKLSRSTKRQPSKINNQHILHWINDVLSINDKTPADKQSYLSAVRDYMIDPASLTAQRISTEDINRIYRCLYVYSEGFGQFVNQICGHSQRLSSNLWKVYTILVENCSRGVVETILSSLIAQNQQIKQKYQEQLQQKQFLIDHNDEINQKKNSKIMKEIKDLTFQNEQLSTEKVFIANELHDSEKAFSEEVSLRLLFEQKINQIHYAYRQINDKHGLLYRDFQQKEKQNAQLTQHNKLLAEQILGLKQKNWGLSQTAKLLQSDITILQDQLKKAQEELEIFHYKDHSKLMQRQAFFIENIQLKHALDRLQKQHSNTQATLKLIQESYHSLQGEYLQVLSDNQRMITAIEKQNQENNIHFRQRVTLSEQMITFQNDKAYFQKKITQKDDKIMQLKAHITKTNETIAIHLQEIQFLKETIAQLQIELESAAKTIQVHHKAAQQSQAIQNDYRIRTETIEAYSSQRQAIISKTKQELVKLEQCLLKSQKREEQLSSQLQRLQSQNRNLSSLLESTEDNLKQKIKKSRQTQNNLERIIKEQEAQLQRIRQMNDLATADLNNEKFERKTLDISYKHSLTVIDSNLTIKKELKTKIAQLYERLQEQRLQIKVNQMKNRQLIERLQSQNKKIKQNSQTIKVELDNKKQHMNQMYYQDIRSLLIAKEERVLELQLLLQELQSQYLDTKNTLSSTLKVKQNQIISLQGKIKEKTAMFALDIEYQKKKHSSLLKRIEELEMETMKQKAKAEAPIYQFRQKEQKYLEAIKQKNERISILLGEIQQWKDKHYLLKKKVSEQEMHIQDQKGQIDHFEGQYKQYKYTTEKYQFEEQQGEIEFQHFRQLIKSQHHQEDDKQLNNSLNKTSFRRSSASQNFRSIDSDINNSTLSKQSKQVKQTGNQFTQIQVKQEQIKIERQSKTAKKSKEQKQMRISNKMKNASIYYSK